LRVSEYFRFSEPLFHYEMDAWIKKSPVLYRPDHRVVHIGGGPRRNHPREINVNCRSMEGVDVVGDAHDLPFADQSVDVIISNAVLEHVRDAEAAIGEIRRVLKPGGFVYIEVPFIQHHHTHDINGVSFGDYRRYTRQGLAQAFDFCQPIEVGVCVGPTSAMLQVVAAYFRSLSHNRIYRGLVDGVYRFAGTFLMQIDRFLPRETIERSAVPSGVFFFGRRPDHRVADVRVLPVPSSAFPVDLRGTIRIRETDAGWELALVNTSKTTWLAESPFSWGAVQVGVQAIRDGSLDRDFLRIRLPHDIPPGKGCAVRLSRARMFGVDRAQVDLVIEGIGWFESYEGKPCLVPGLAARPARPAPVAVPVHAKHVREAARPRVIEAEAPSASCYSRAREERSPV